MLIFQHIGLEVPENPPEKEFSSSGARKEFRVGNSKDSVSDRVVSA